jgi:hypothetical protein
MRSTDALGIDINVCNGSKLGCCGLKNIRFSHVAPVGALHVICAEIPQASS